MHLRGVAGCAVLNSWAVGSGAILPFPLETDVPQHKSSDDTVGRIYELTDRLQERLKEAERIRARYTRAHDANIWPNLDGAIARLLSERDPRED